MDLLSTSIQPNTAHLSSHGHDHVCLPVLHSDCPVALDRPPLEGEQELGEGTDSGCFLWILCMGCLGPQIYRQVTLDGIFKSLGLGDTHILGCLVRVSEGQGPEVHSVFGVICCVCMFWVSTDAIAVF